MRCDSKRVAVLQYRLSATGADLCLDDMVRFHASTSCMVSVAEGACARAGAYTTQQIPSNITTRQANQHHRACRDIRDAADVIGHLTLTNQIHIATHAGTYTTRQMSHDASAHQINQSHHACRGIRNLTDAAESCGHRRSCAELRIGGHTQDARCPVLSSGTQHPTRQAGGLTVSRSALQHPDPTLSAQYPAPDTQRSVLPLALSTDTKHPASIAKHPMTNTKRPAPNTPTMSAAHRLKACTWQATYANAREICRIGILRVSRTFNAGQAVSCVSRRDAIRGTSRCCAMQYDAAPRQRHQQPRQLTVCERSRLPAEPAAQKNAGRQATHGSSRAHPASRIQSSQLFSQAATSQAAAAQPHSAVCSCAPSRSKSAMR